MHTQLRPSHRQLGVLAASLVATTVLLGHATPASATGATGTVDTHSTRDGVKVEINDKKLSTQLIPVRLDGGGKVFTYCIDFTTAAKHDARMIEDDWKNYPNPATSFKADPAKVNWILQHSFPHLKLDELRDAAGIDELSEREAIAGTQLAIWHFSNNTEPGNDNNRDVLALYTYLTGDRNTGLTAEPAPTLSLTPATVTGRAPGKVGPLTVRTTAKSVKLTLKAGSGAALTDASGAPVAQAGDGAKVYLTVPAGAATGTATVEATVSATIQTGRLFRGDRVTTQTLITASNTPVTVDDRAEFAWRPAGQPVPSSTPTPSETPSASPSPSDSSAPSESPSPGDTPTPSASAEPGGGGGLPMTGFQTGMIAAIGVVLLAGGAALFFLARRRRHA
jgi:TQXA domain-containing protein/LPXTG-motif cell wall-anchored protein